MRTKETAHGINETKTWFLEKDKQDPQTPNPV